MKIPKTMYCVARTRRNRTHFFYAYRLKDMFKHLRVGDLFSYVKYLHTGERIGKYNGKTWSEFLGYDAKSNEVFRSRKAARQ